MSKAQLNNQAHKENRFSKDEFLKSLSDLDATHVNIGIFDLNGVFRHKRVAAQKAAKLFTDGYPFCDVLYKWDIAEKTYGGGVFDDQQAVLDASSLRSWPFGGKEAICIADFSGSFGELSPRNQLVSQLERAREAGFSVHSAFEFEFTILDETPETLREKSYDDLKFVAPGNRTYSLRTAVQHQELIEEFQGSMEKMDVAFDAFHTELGPGCFEVPLKHAEGLKSADDAALFKNFAKAFFATKSMTAGFMSKLDNDMPGQSGHLHLSLRALKDGSPVFYDGDTENGLSETALHFIGGITTLLPDWLALCSHTVNAYKRLVPGAWAPTYSAWGIQNRTSAVRVINDSAQSTRVEFRVPSADTNPYSALAMLLAAGLWGIEGRVKPSAMRSDDCYATNGPQEAQFPNDLGAAADRLAKSTPAREVFGDAFVDGFAHACRMEDLEYRRYVSAWDRERYLEIV